MARINIKVGFTLLFVSITFLMTSCNDDETVEDVFTVEDYNYQQVGDSLSTISQQTLLSNIGRELKAGGPVKAIGFCNLSASKLMDSLSNQYKVKISRITLKPRNSSNMATGFEIDLLKSLESSGLKDTLTAKENQITYYKAIKIGMPTCLKCHGVPETDINETTMDAIQKRYPKDLATNYGLGDFRGAWKIQFRE